MLCILDVFTVPVFFFYRFALFFRFLLLLHFSLVGSAHTRSLFVKSEAKTFVFCFFAFFIFLCVNKSARKMPVFDVFSVHGFLFVGIFLSENRSARKMSDSKLFAFLSYFPCFLFLFCYAYFFVLFIYFRVNKSAQ